MGRKRNMLYGPDIGSKRKIKTRAQAKSDGDRYYYTGKRCKSDHLSKRFTYNGACYECVQKSGKRWYHKNKSDRDWVIDRKMQRIKNRAKRSGIEFDLVREDLNWPEVCPVLGIKLDYTGKDRWSQVSLDRTDSSKGYIKGNVVVMSMRANSLKQDITAEEVDRLYAYLKANLSIKVSK